LFAPGFDEALMNEKWARSNPHMVPDDHDGHNNPRRNGPSVDASSDEDDGSDEAAPEIARLTNFARFYSISEQEEAADDDDFADIIGPEQDETSSLESLKLMLASLKPFLVSRLQEKRQMVQVLEVYPTGETGYKTAMTLSRLAQLVHELVEKIGNGGGGGGLDDDGGEGSAAVDGGSSGSGVPSSSSSSSQSVAASAVGAKAKSPVPFRERSHDIREIHYYDLRYLENQFNAHEEPMILVRKHAVVMSLSPLRAIVTADRIILSVPDGADALLYMLHEHMHEIVEDTLGVLDDSGVLPPEIRAYKALFLTIIAIHQQEYSSICKKVDKALKRFRSTNKITSEIRESIRVLKNTVEAQEIKVKAYQRLLKDLLNNSDDLALMNLSLLKENPNLYKKPLVPEILRCKEEVAEHLESSLLDYDTLETKLDFLRVQIENTNRLIFARLNTFQNDLLIVQVVLDCIMVALAVGTLIGAGFGMHLMSGLETVDVYAFWVLGAGIVCISFVIFIYLHGRYRLTGTVPLLNAKRKKMIRRKNELIASNEESNRNRERT